MLIKEYRIALPFSVEEFQVGQLFAVAEASKNETGGGEGVEVVSQKQFRSKSILPGSDLKGVYTYKIYRFKSKVPYVFRKLFPDAAFVVHEESWNAYPYTKTILTNPDYMKENFKITIETMHAPDRGEQANILNLPRDVIKKREVVYLDIADDRHVRKSDINDDNNVGAFKSEKTGRGPLKPGWARKHRPVMCAYKVVSVHFKWFGLQGRVEKAIHNTYPRLFVKLHREAFCWIDRWFELTMEDIRALEAETANKLKEDINEGEIKGMAAEDDADDKKEKSNESEEED